MTDNIIKAYSEMNKIIDKYKLTARQTLGVLKQLETDANLAYVMASIVKTFKPKDVRTKNK